MYWNPLTTQEQDQLIALGIDANLFYFFRRKFVPNGFDFNIDSGNGWRACTNRHVSNAELIAHLAGDAVVAVRCGRDPRTAHYVTDQLTIDLDDGQDLWDRVDRVMRAFGVPVLSLSSNSGGMHARYFLEEPIELWTLLDPNTGDGIVPRLLLEVGLEPMSGRVEIYPQGKYEKISSGNALRLPFGKGSRFIDAYDRMPMTIGGPIRDLLAVRQLFADEKIEPLSPSELADRARRVRRKKPKPAGAVLPAAKSDGPRIQLLRRLVTTGLTGPGQFNEALYTLSVDYALRRVPKEDAQCLLRRWVEERTNGHSRTFERSQDDAFREADEVLTSVYSRWEERNSWAPRPGLTSFENAWIVAATLTQRKLKDAVTGAEFEAGKVQRFIRDVHDGMKQWVLTRSLRVAETIAVRNPRVAVGSAQFDTWFLEAARSFWPFPPVPLFIVENPYVFRSKVMGVSERTVGALWRIAKETRLFIPHLGACAGAQRAESFAVQLDFGVRGDTTTHSLGAGIIQLLPPSTIREQYSDHFARKIRAEGATEFASRFPLANELNVRSYVEWRLSGACPSCAERNSGLACASTADRKAPDGVEVSNDKSDEAEPPRDGQSPMVGCVFRRPYTRSSRARRRHV